MLKRLLDYNDGEEMDIVVLIKNSQLRRNKKDKLFLAMQFGDGSGEIRGNYWDASHQDAATFSTGTIVELNERNIRVDHKLEYIVCVLLDHKRDIHLMNLLNQPQKPLMI